MYMIIIVYRLSYLIFNTSLDRKKNMPRNSLSLSFSFLHTVPKQHIHTYSQNYIILQRGYVPDVCESLFRFFFLLSA